MKFLKKDLLVIIATLILGLGIAQEKIPVSIDPASLLMIYLCSKKEEKTEQ